METEKRPSAPVAVFPGQGAQKPGMGESFRAEPLYRAQLERADQLLGIGLSRLIAEGPAEELTRTEVAQPALLTVATGIYQVWRARSGHIPAAVAGHSLGEYSALVAAEVLSFDAALELVRLRGQLMQQACSIRPGAMAAVLKPETAEIEALCQASEGRVVIANVNSPQQIVLSGEAEALETILAQIRTAKLGRGVPLKVSGAFHSRLMEPARAELTAALEATPFAAARCPVVLNVSGEAISSGDAIRAQLCRQLTAPVKWQASVASLADLSEQFLEFGPTTLSPLIRQCQPQALVSAIATIAELEALNQAS